MPRPELQARKLPSFVAPSCCLLLAAWPLIGCHTRPRPDTAAGFAPKPASLHGTYGVQQGTELIPVLKVDDSKTGYTFSERQEGEWQPDPQVPHVATEAEVERALGLASVTGFPVYGLVTDRALLLKVPAGWSSPNVANASARPFTTRTGYILAGGQRLQEAKKVELGGR